jgi:hypothetical protein
MAQCGYTYRDNSVGVALHTAVVVQVRYLSPPSHLSPPLTPPSLLPYTITPCNWQSMVYGNWNSRSGSGTAFTRNPHTGERELFGEYLSLSEVSMSAMCLFVLWLSVLLSSIRILICTCTCICTHSPPLTPPTSPTTTHILIHT